MPDYMLGDDLPQQPKDGDHKKTFQFRMSKKVAELTQVVHMLFTRNHEKEVELEALKDSYEHEVGLVIKDAKERIATLEKKLNALQKKKVEEDFHDKASFEKETAQKEEEWRLRMAGLLQKIADEKKESQNVRDLLIQAQDDIEKLKQDQSDMTQEIDEKVREVERIKHQVCMLEKCLREADSDSNGGLLELKGKIEKLKCERTAIQENLAKSERLREQNLVKNKQLEGEIRSLKKEFAKRSDRRNSMGSRQDLRESGHHNDLTDELSRLRREVQYYRNELNNREENFNRMFTPQHPVVLDKRAGRMAFGESAHLRYTIGNRESTFAVTYPTNHQNMSKSQIYETRSVSGIEERDLLHLHHAHATTSRLPHLGMDPRRRPSGDKSRLARPRPISREKTGVHG